MQRQQKIQPNLRWPQIFFLDRNKPKHNWRFESLLINCEGEGGEENNGIKKKLLTIYNINH